MPVISVSNVLVVHHYMASLVNLDIHTLLAQIPGPHMGPISVLIITQLQPSPKVVSNIRLTVGLSNFSISCISTLTDNLSIPNLTLCLHFTSVYSYTRAFC